MMWTSCNHSRPDCHDIIFQVKNMAAKWPVATMHFPSDQRICLHLSLSQTQTENWSWSLIMQEKFGQTCCSVFNVSAAVYRFYPLSLSVSSCRPQFCVEFLAELWETMNSTSSLFQQGGVWTTVLSTDLHSCILFFFSTWEENVHHQIACLRDIKEWHWWLCECALSGE